ncbi:hypothetical protein XPA_008457 [Xanthoria parietina]
MSIVASCPSEQLACDRHVSRVGSFDITISSFSFSISIRHWVSLESFIMSRFFVLCFLSSTTCWANLAGGGAVPSSRSQQVRPVMPLFDEHNRPLLSLANFFTSMVVRYPI